MRNLRAIRDSQRGMDIQILETLVKSFTIQEKIEFSSYLTKRIIRDKIADLRDRQVPNRKVLLEMKDEDVLFLWLKNFIHPDLNHWVFPIPRDQRGCSKIVRLRDAKLNTLRTYENSQHYYNYTLADIEEFVGTESLVPGES